MKEAGSWGFDQYDITWTNRKKNFELFAFTSEFFGFYLNEKNTGGDEHHIDIFVRVKGKQVFNTPKFSLGVISIPYEFDPREDMRSLRSDICAAINQWHYQRCTSGIMYQDLIGHLNNPTLTVTNLDALLKIKVKIDELIKGGGREMLKINDTSVIIDIPHHAQDTILELPVPTTSTPGISPEMIQAVSKFDASGETDAKKLRKRLRRLGWTGGLRKLRENIKSTN